jgi:hypothetical protein
MRTQGHGGVHAPSKDKPSGATTHLEFIPKEKQQISVYVEVLNDWAWINTVR